MTIVNSRGGTTRSEFPALSATRNSWRFGTRLIARLCRLSFVVCLIFLSLSSPSRVLSAAGEPLDYDFPDGHFYRQANGAGGDGTLGFAIVDNASARLWSEFRRLGGVGALGYPASQRFIWDGFVSQATQRAVLQWRPETGQVAFVNVFDWLHDQGRDALLQAAFQVPKPADWSSDTGKSWSDVVAAHLALLDANSAIKAKYYGVVGDPIQMNGLPMAPITDMGNVFVLRAQRVVFQQWKADVPWAKAGDVTVALGGDIAKQLGLLPSPSALQAAAAPPLANPIAMPANQLEQAREKIKHVVIIMQENRSFDSYFGTFPGADGIPMENGQFTVCNLDPQTGQCIGSVTYSV